MVSIVFDPFDFVVPFTLTAKQILKDLCRIKLGWEDDISPEYHSSWEKWLTDVLNLSSFSVNHSVFLKSFWMPEKLLMVQFLICIYLMKKEGCTVLSSLQNLV